MKTPMQILLEKIENGDFLHPKVIGEFIKYNLLDKEKDVIMDAYMAGESDATHKIDSALNHYNETFNNEYLSNT